MEITVLLENTTKQNNMETEHGLSLYIKASGINILFDMGQTDMFLRNAEKLGLDLADIDIAVLSHGHYDHGGGLGKFLEVNKKAPVYINRNAFEPHFNGTEKYIGLDTGLSANKRLIFTDTEFSICSGMTLYPAAPDITGKFTSAGLTHMENGMLFPEDFRHEQYLEIVQNDRKVLFSGCSHRGITNIVKHFSPDVLVGGFHFSKMPIDRDLCDYAVYLDSFRTSYYTCHCTGECQTAFLSGKMKDLHSIHCGDRIVI